MITPLFKLNAIACLVISSSLIGSSVTAEPKLEVSADPDALSVSIKNTEAVIEKGTSEAPSQSLPDFQRESALTISQPKYKDLELNTNSQEWQNNNTGYGQRDSFKLKFR